MTRYIIILASVLLACRPAEPKVEGEKPLVVCTTDILSDAVSKLLPGCDVKALMGPGIDPHLFKPGKRSLDLLQSADVIVGNGLYLEGRMLAMLDKLSRNKPVYLLEAYIPEGRLLHPAGDPNVADPHVWMDASLYMVALEGLHKDLALELASCSEALAAREYLQELDSLDKWIQRELEDLPSERRVLFSTHHAFAYFGAAYGFRLLAVQGISTAAEYGLKDIEMGIQGAIEMGAVSIFEESGTSKRPVQAVIAGCKSRGYTLKEGGMLYVDALGGPNSQAATYIEMMRYNVQTIKNALQ